MNPIEYKLTVLIGSLGLILTAVSNIYIYILLRRYLGYAKLGFNLFKQYTNETSAYFRDYILVIVEAFITVASSK